MSSQPPSPPPSTARPTLLPPVHQNPFISTYASRSDRLFGQVLDGIIGSLPMLGSVVIMSFSDTLGLVFLLPSVVWSMGYYLFADGLRAGQSFGKRYLGTRVVDARSGGSCTFGQSFVRNVLLAILGPLDWIF